jgi:hypothetical protein
MINGFMIVLPMLMEWIIGGGSRCRGTMEEKGGLNVIGSFVMKPLAVVIRIDG